MATTRTGTAPERRRNAEHWNDFFNRQVAGESERAIVIIAAAMLEQALEVMLRSRLVPSPAQTDALFDGAYAPISSFSAKIDLAYRIGLIPASFAKGLHLVRRIRNDFAHNVTGCSFADASVRSRLVELVNAEKVVEGARQIRNAFPDGALGEFQMTVSWMLWHLWRNAEAAVALEAKADNWHIVPEELHTNDVNPGAPTTKNE